MLIFLFDWRFHGRDNDNAGVEGGAQSILLRLGFPSVRLHTNNVLLTLPAGILQLQAGLLYERTREREWRRRREATRTTFYEWANAWMS